MPQLHETRLGQQFLAITIPALVKAIEKLTIQVELMNQQEAAKASNALYEMENMENLRRK